MGADLFNFKVRPSADLSEVRELAGFFSEPYPHRRWIKTPSSFSPAQAVRDRRREATGDRTGMDRHCMLQWKGIVGSNPALQVNPSSMRCWTESWLLTSSSKQRGRPALKLRLVPARANPAGLDGPPQ